MAHRFRLFTRDLSTTLNQSSNPMRLQFVVLIDTLSDDSSLRKSLESLFNSTYTRLTTMNELASYMRDNQSDKTLLILIVSNSFIQHVMKSLKPSKFKFLNVYLLDASRYDHLIVEKELFGGSFTNEPELLHQLERDIEYAMSSKSGTSFEFVGQDDGAKYYWYLFFFSLLHRISDTVSAKLEVASQWRRNCKLGSREDSLASAFEEKYDSNECIVWYTTHSSFHFLLNEALRSRDINQIFRWRMTVKDIETSLRKLSNPDSISRIGRLYRGQKMRTRDIDRLQNNLGKLLVASSFLSTTRVREIALMFAGSVSEQSDYHRVLITIDIDFINPRIIAPDISSYSFYREEKENLFTLRSLFRADSVKLIDDLYHVHLTALGDDHPDYLRLIEPWQISVGQHTFFQGRRQPLFTRFINRKNNTFLAFQLLLDMMLRLDQTTFARDEMIELFRMKYADQPHVLEKITHFEQTYQQTDAIKWYTTDSFLYRLLNELLRKEDIDGIFKMRYFIQDLHNQLAQEQKSYLASLPASTSVLTFYRGKRTSIDALKEISENEGELISMNSFVSTTNDSVAATFFAGIDTLDDPDREVSVVYQISVDVGIAHSVPFASIAYKSIYKDEAEVLFSMAAVFRIGEVEKYGKLWVVNLTLINKEDEEWNQLTAHLN